MSTRKVVNNASKEENKLVKKKISKAEKDKRMRQSVRDSLLAQQNKEGFTKKSSARVSGIRDVSRNSERRKNSYLQSLLRPEETTSYIPDNCTFPRSVQQLREVFTCYTYAVWPAGQDAPIVYNDIAIAIYPFPRGAFNPVTGAYTSGTGTPTEDPFDFSQYEGLSANAQGFRPVSMMADFKYIGEALDNKGEIAVACYPPYVANTTKKIDGKRIHLMSVPRDRPKISELDKSTKKLGAKTMSLDTVTVKNGLRQVNLTPGISFENISDYNYSYNGAARDGGRQIWMPGSSTDFNFIGIDDDITEEFDQHPFITMGARGLPGPDIAGMQIGDVRYNAVFECITVLNVEIYSIAQILTAPKVTIVANSAQMSHAATVVQAATAQNLTGSSSDDSDSVYTQISKIAKDAWGWIDNNKETIGAISSAVASFF